MQTVSRAAAAVCGVHLKCIGLVWFGLGWFGLDCALVWFGLVWVEELMARAGIVSQD